MAKNFIKKAIKHPGALHKALGVPLGKKIPAKKLAAAKKNASPLMKRRLALAQTLKSIRGGK